jgi:hypothetical protein
MGPVTPARRTPLRPARHRHHRLEPELVTLLREHKLAARWSQPDDFIFAGRYRNKPHERNSRLTSTL